MFNSVQPDDWLKIEKLKWTVDDLTIFRNFLFHFATNNFGFFSFANRLESISDKEKSIQQNDQAYFL